MELVTLTTTVVLSIALGLVASRFLLDALFFAMTRGIRPAEITSTETQHEQPAIRVVAPAA